MKLILLVVVSGLSNGINIDVGSVHICVMTNVLIKCWGAVYFGFGVNTFMLSFVFVSGFG